MCQRVRIPKCCDTLIYSSLTVPKGDCNIKCDCPFLQLATHDALLHAAHMWRKFTKPVSFSLVRAYFSCRTWDQHNSLSGFFFFFFSRLHPCFPACLVLSFNYMFLNKPTFGPVEIQVLVLPTEALAMPLGCTEWPKGLLPRGQSKQTVVLLMLSHM